MHAHAGWVVSRERSRSAYLRSYGARLAAASSFTLGSGRSRRIVGGINMIQRVKSSVAQRFDSTLAVESELVPLTLADDDSPRSLSPPSASMDGRRVGGGSMEGRELAYAGSASDTVMAWPAAADAKLSGKGSPNSTVNTVRLASASSGLRSNALFCLALLRYP